MPYNTMGTESVTIELLAPHTDELVMSLSPQGRLITKVGGLEITVLRYHIDPGVEQLRSIGDSVPVAVQTRPALVELEVPLEDVIALRLLGVAFREISHTHSVSAYR